MFKSWLSAGRSQSLDDLLTDFARTLPARRSPVRSLDPRFIEALRVAVNVPSKSWRSTLAAGMARVAREAARLGVTPSEAQEAVERFARRAEMERWAQPCPGTGGMMTVGEVEQLAHNTAWEHAHSLLSDRGCEPYRPPDWLGV